MPFFQTILQFLDTQWEQPLPYGAFHLICLALMLVAAFVLCLLWRLGVIKNVRRVVLVTAIIVGIFEIYKQINFTFGNGSGEPNYQWYAFPWQFCSTPLYIGLLAGLTKGKIHKCFSSYLASYAFFAGLAVMLYPTTVFTPTVGICIQTMLCHGSMVVIAIFLHYTDYVKADHTTLLKALPVFTANVSVAIALNELAPVIGITEEHTFNMFFFSRHFESDLPVYSLLHNALVTPGDPWSLQYVLCLILYIFGFTVCAAVMILIPYGLKRLFGYDFASRYAEADRLKAKKKLLKKEEKRLEEERLLAETDEKLEQIKKEKAAKKEAARKAKEKKRAEKEKALEKKLSREQLEKRRKKQKEKEKKKKEREEKRREKAKIRAEKKAARIEARRKKAEERAKAKEAEKLALLGNEIYLQKLAEKKARELERQEKKELRAAKKAERLAEQAAKKEAEKRELLGEEIYEEKKAEQQARELARKPKDEKSSDKKEKSAPKNQLSEKELEKIELLGREIYEKKKAEKEAREYEKQLKKENKQKYAELKEQQKAEKKLEQMRELLGEDMYAKKLAEKKTEQKAEKEDGE